MRYFWIESNKKNEELKEYQVKDDSEFQSSLRFERF